MGTINYPLSDRFKKGKMVQLNLNFDPQTKIMSVLVNSTITATQEQIENN